MARNKDLPGTGLTSQRARDRLVARLAAMGIRSREALDAIATVPRHIFVDEALQGRAYDNSALPIGYHQTISQPYIVARIMEALLTIRKAERVLEVGTGCGYQTAVLACLVRQVFSIERISALLSRARANLGLLEIRNTHLKYGDGSRGWLSHSPYDGIVVSAAFPDIPAELLGQLVVGGRLIAPVERGQGQRLLRVVRTAEGYRETELDWVSFVPMRRGVV